MTTTSDEGSSSIGASMTVAATEAVIAVSAGNDVPDLATTSEAVVVGTVRNIPTSAVKVVPSAIAGTTAPSAGTSTVLVANPTPSAVPGANTSATASGTVSVAVSVARTAVAGVTTSALPGAGSIVSVGVTPVVTVAAMAAAPTVLTAVSSASLTEGRDARIVRFNNRDLENLRKIQDELNVRKAGGALPRSPGSPIVIKAEITSPHRIATVSTMTQASSSSTATRATTSLAGKGLVQAQQVVVVQKPSTSSPNHLLSSPKKADIRVIHPPGVTVRRQLQMTTTSGVGAGQGGVTKVIINPTLGGQLVAGPTGALQLVGTVGQSSSQPTTALLLSSPTRGVGGATVRTGQQLVRLATHGGSGAAPKGMYVVSPMKLGGKVAMIPITMGKSPQRIAPAPSSVATSLVATGVTLGTTRLALATAGTTGTTATATTALRGTPTTVVQGSGKVNVLLRTTSTPKVAGTTGMVQGLATTAVVATTGTATVVSTVSGSAAVQVPGSKFHYVRLVSAPTATQGSTVVPVSKTSTLIPLTTARPLVVAGASTVTSTASGTPSSNLRLTVPIAPAISAQQQGSSVSASTSQKVLIPASSVASGGQVRSSGSLGATQLGSLHTGTLISTGGTSMQNAFVVVPAQYVTQFQQTSQPALAASAPSVSATSGTVSASSRVVLQSSSGLLGTSVVTASTSGNFVPIAAAAPSMQSVSAQADHPQPQQSDVPLGHIYRVQLNGTSTTDDSSRPRKPCNCTKSQCLKLYCDCFANGEFCHSCNCNNCFNNLEHEEERQKAISACLDRNPNAFRPKIGKGKEGDHERRHTKGCNCKRSGCLKNYCECYEAKILCSSMCKCVGCKNFEDSSERKTLMQLADAAEVRVQQQAAARTKMSACDMPMRPPAVSDTGERLPFAFITQEVVEATCQCLLACAGEGDKQKLPFHEVERSVLEEFGHCLLAIIDSANKTKGRPPDRSSDKRPEPTHQVQPCFTQDRSSVRRTKTARRMLDL